VLLELQRDEGLLYGVKRQLHEPATPVDLEDLLQHLEELECVFRNLLVTNVDLHIGVFDEFADLLQTVRDILAYHRPDQFVVRGFPVQREETAEGLTANRNQLVLLVPEFDGDLYLVRLIQ